MQISKKQSEADYYKEYMNLLFEQGENFQNFKQVALEYQNTLNMKEELIKKLENEIDIIKSLKA